MTSSSTSHIQNLVYKLQAYIDFGFTSRELVYELVLILNSTFHCRELVLCTMWISPNSCIYEYGWIVKHGSTRVGHQLAIGPSTAVIKQQLERECWMVSFSF